MQHQSERSHHRRIIENLRGNPSIYAWEESDFGVGNAQHFRLEPCSIHSSLIVNGSNGKSPHLSTDRGSWHNTHHDKCTYRIYWQSGISNSPRCIWASFLRSLGIAPPTIFPRRDLPNKCWLTLETEMPSCREISSSVIFLKK